MRFPLTEAGLALPVPRTAGLSVARIRIRWLPWLSLAGVLALALALNTWSLSSAGYGNTYYAAAVRSMTMSWKNFFFGALDPGGFITVDKPPAFLWVGALSARVFGYSSWSLLMPSAIAGAASVGLLWLIVRRYFGLTAATVSAVVLALTPISVAVNRLNLPEPFLILALVAATGAVLRSLESKRWWAWLALAGFLVGVGFNIKMLAAWIPGPAFAAAVVVATTALSRRSLQQVLARLAVLLAVTVVVSASWMTAVDLWPASARPYVGGSTNNTELQLALGYNGFSRVDGNSQGGPGGGARPTFNTRQAPPPNAATRQPFAGGGALPGGGTPPGGAAAAAGAGGFRGPGGILGGIPGLLRMFDDANGGQIGWLLPFALGGAVIAFWSWRRDPVRRAAAVLFLGWVLLFGAVFSYAQGIFHSYYTSAMAPGIAALVGIGTVALANLIRHDRRWLLAAAGLVALTAWTQLQLADRTPGYYNWVTPLTVAVTIAGVAVEATLALRRMPVAGGLVLAVGGLLLLPAAWSVGAAANTSLNATLPQAGPRQGASGATFGSQAFDSGTPQLAAWLQSHADPNARWQLAVTSAQTASPLIAEYRLSVMALGGFSGTDNSISVKGFADLVSSGAVRYVLAGEGGGRGGNFGGRGFPGATARGGFGASATSGPTAVMSAVESVCKRVTDTTLPSRYQGSLYDCAGQGSALAQQAP